MVHVKLSCGKTIQLLPEHRRQDNLDDIIKLLSETQNKQISKTDQDYSLSAAVNDLGCYIKNNCQHQIYLEGRLYCFSPELIEHYKIKSED